MFRMPLIAAFNIEHYIINGILTNQKSILTLLVRQNRRKLLSAVSFREFAVSYLYMCTNEITPPLGNVLF